jgi:hypothetical protein
VAHGTTSSAWSGYPLGRADVSHRLRARWYHVIPGHLTPTATIGGWTGLRERGGLFLVSTLLGPAWFVAAKKGLLGEWGEGRLSVGEYTKGVLASAALGAMAGLIIGNALEPDDCGRPSPRTRFQARM